ncbi:hypothetical protein AMJ51_02370 [Microgenomates bacterium DG_75]|nr:MAG: hypothetical protein AMJ51_02370 [Microgenomates bacterium DG_75]
MPLFAFNISETLFGEHPGLTSSTTLGGIITSILPNIYVISGIILFFFLIGGGLMFIISAGRENPEGAARGGQIITMSLVGFLIIFASYWIMQIVQIVTGIDILGGGGL